MGDIEKRLAAKLAKAKKKRVREEGIAKLKGQLKAERSASFKARFGGVVAGAKQIGGTLQKAANNAAKQQAKKKPSRPAILDFKF